MSGHTRGDEPGDGLSRITELADPGDAADHACGHRRGHDAAAPAAAAWGVVGPMRTAGTAGFLGQRDLEGRARIVQILSGLERTVLTQKIPRSVGGGRTGLPAGDPVAAVTARRTSTHQSRVRFVTEP